MDLLLFCMLLLLIELEFFKVLKFYIFTTILVLELLFYIFLFVLSSSDDFLGWLDINDFWNVYKSFVLRLVFG